MASNQSAQSEGDVSNLHRQLTVARNEIHNLRQQIRALGHSQQKELDKIYTLLDSWQCSSCRRASIASSNHQEESVCLQPIGIVSTWFPEKKGTPRQPGICVNSRGKLTLFNTVFTNPEHALEGLDGFSHMWILFHFHKNESTHVRAKVSPPRLNGARTGVFGTRSPHRPSPIGLSLVSIDRIEESTIYFSGVDMLDGTPVLDIKPYIPQYDNPLHCDSPEVGSINIPTLRLMDGREAESESLVTASGDTNPAVVAAIPSPSCTPLQRITVKPEGRIGEREAPDGEEGTHAASAVPPPPSGEARPAASASQVRVPAWIAHPPVSKLAVTFSDRARVQLESISSSSDASDGPLNAIRSVLREDPRSVYLRERWGNQFYTFLICNLHVSCKFDDILHTVMVFQVKSAGKLCECGQPEWQCSTHGEASD